MRLPRSLASLLAPLAVGALACATGSDDGNDDAFVSTSSATSPSTTDPVTTDPVSTDPVTTVDPDTMSEAESTPGDSSSGGGLDVPSECVPGALDCPCDRGECTEPALCEADVCVAPIECDPDPNEPNEYDDEATDLGEISDDNAETLDVVGVLAGPDDVDWFTYHGTDVLGETVDPSRMLVIEGGTLELCKFFSCNAGKPQIVCPAGTMSVMEGLDQGCCAAQSFNFDEDGVECIGGAFDTGGTVLIRLRNASAQCVSYSGTVHF